MSTRKFAPFLLGMTALLVSTAASAGAPLGRFPYGGIDTDGLPHIIYVGNDQHIYEASLIANQWRWADLTRLSGGPTVLRTSTVMTYVRSDGLTSVVYMNDQRHIFELYAGTRWRARDMTADAGLTFGPNAGGAAGYVRSDNTNAVIFQAGTASGDIHELTFSSSSGHWRDNNLTTTATNMRPAWNGSNFWHPTARADGSTSIPYDFRSAGVNYSMELFFSGGHWTVTPVTSHEALPDVLVRANNTTALVSVADDQHLRYQALTGQTSWSLPTDLSAALGAPPVLSLGSPIGYKRPGNIECIVYPDPNSHIRELSVENSVWQLHDLTAETGAPITWDSAMYPYLRDGVTSIPFGNNGHIYDLYFADNTWHVLDVTANATPQ